MWILIILLLLRNSVCYIDYQCALNEKVLHKMKRRKIWYLASCCFDLTYKCHKSKDSAIDISSLGFLNNSRKEVQSFNDEASNYKFYATEMSKDLPLFVVIQEDSMNNPSSIWNHKRCLILFILMKFIQVNFPKFSINLFSI